LNLRAHNGLAPFAATGRFVALALGSDSGSTDAHPVTLSDRLGTVTAEKLAAGAQADGQPARESRAGEEGRLNVGRYGLTQVPLTQLRVGLGSASPTLRNPLPQSWGRGKEEGSDAGEPDRSFTSAATA
jgi:hypothetical protein